MKKSFIEICCLVLLLPLFIIFVSSHSGKTDSHGGHVNSSTGEYHYHHGYPAHQHYDMNGDGIIDCPYDFDDKTSHDSSSGSSNSSSSSNSNNKTHHSTSESNNRLTVRIVFKIIGISLLFLLVSSAGVIPLAYVLLDSMISFLSKRLFKTKPKDSISFIITIITVAVIVVTIVSIVILKNENVI